ncbi:MAG: prepilin-type N-terminal cleavage/methylation domain-containing protein [Gemmatimonadaceae bacterium]|nr:prepilin-type N-terminal cleavage/methylation domain-containing protein [Gemmatimonadaceae bacterium]
MRVNRRGFALVELLTALVITSMLGAALFRLVDRTQRFTRGTALMADQRAQLAVAAFAVEAALQGVAPSDGDVLVAADSSVSFLAPVGSAIACALGGGFVDVASPVIASGATLTWWNTAPQAGDSIAILDDGSLAGAADDRWVHAEVTAISALPNACLHSPFLDSIADAGRVGWRLAASPALPPTVTPGAVVRVGRPERFALDRSAGEWMAGWTEWNPIAGRWNVIQPVAGPLLPYAAPGSTSGMSFRWRDSLGAVLSSAGPGNARVVEVSLGAVTRHAVRMDGAAGGMRRDSLTVRIPLRNLP